MSYLRGRTFPPLNGTLLCLTLSFLSITGFALCKRYLGTLRNDDDGRRGRERERKICGCVAFSFSSSFMSLFPQGRIHCLFSPVVSKISKPKHVLFKSYLCDISWLTLI